MNPVAPGLNWRLSDTLRFAPLENWIPTDTLSVGNHNAPTTIDTAELVLLIAVWFAMRLAGGLPTETSTAFAAVHVCPPHVNSSRVAIEVALSRSSDTLRPRRTCGVTA